MIGVEIETPNHFFVFLDKNCQWVSEESDKRKALNHFISILLLKLQWGKGSDFVMQHLF